MAKEYEKDLEDYKKIKAMYESSLTDKQKEDIKRLKEEMAIAKEKRKTKAEYKELGRPKKPMSSYFLFTQSRSEVFKGKALKEFQEEIKKEWIKLPASEKVKFEKQASDLMAKYKKDLEAWELKMISIGRTDLVRNKPLREKKPKAVKKQQELGCSDETLDSSHSDIVQSIDKHTSTSPDTFISNKETKVPPSCVTSEASRQSTGDVGLSDKASVPQSVQSDQPKQSKNIFSSIKNFFNR